MRIAFTGDILFQNPINDLCKTSEGYDYKECLESVEKYFKACDYVVANPETPFATERLGFTSERYSFNTPSEALRDLKKVGVNLVTLANNHAMDRAYEGLLETVKEVKKSGLEFIGVSDGDRNSIKIKDFGFIKIAFVNATYGTNAFSHHNYLPKDKHLSAISLIQPEEELEGATHLLESNEKIEKEVFALYGDKKEGNVCAKPYLDALSKDIKYAKNNADYVVMLLHSGGQYNEEADAYTKLVCKKIKTMGADIIIANHPHIILSSEIDGDGFFTAYCLGNLMSAFKHNEERSKINWEYSILFYLDFVEGESKPKLSFSIMRHISSESAKPKVYNAYDYYLLTGDKQTEKNIIAFANRFIKNKNYDKAQREYQI